MRDLLVACLAYCMLGWQRLKNMKSGGGVLCISTLQLVVGLILLGVYEGYKATYYTKNADTSSSDPNLQARNMYLRSPLDFVYWLAIVNNVFSIFGFAGVINAQRELVTAFFSYNAVQMVVSFHYFIDVCTDVSIIYPGQPQGLTPYEQSAAAFIFFNCLLSVCATIFAMKAIDEIKTKQREEYNRLTVLSDTLQYEDQ